VKNDWHYLYNRARWGQIRSIQLQLHPLCKMCEEQGLLTAATVVDHIIPHKGNEELFFNGPFQSLCKLHHDSSKQTEENRGIQLGGNIHGEPTDSNHHWNK